MASTFNPQKDLNAWIQDDWESDDHIEKGRGKTEVYRSAQKTEEKSSGWIWALAIAVYILKSPMFWIAVLIIGFIKG